MIVTTTITWADCTPSPLWSPASAAAAPAGRPPRRAWQDLFKFALNLFDQTISIDHSIIRLESQANFHISDSASPSKGDFSRNARSETIIPTIPNIFKNLVYSKTFSFGEGVNFWQSHLVIFPIIGSDDYVTGVNITKVRFYLIWSYCEYIDKDLKCARIPSSGSRILTS